MLKNKIVVGLSLIGGFLAVIISLGSGSALFSLIAGILFFFALIVWKYGYLIIPAITKATNIVEVRDEYEILPSREHIVKKSYSGYYASKFLEIRFYESSLDKDTSGKQYLFESFERMLGSIRHIVKISLLIGSVDMSKHIDDIKTKRSAAEAKKAQGNLDEADRIRLEREIAYWNRLLEKISGGDKPIEILAYAQTTAFGLTKDEAVSRVNRQAKEIKTIISSSLGCEVIELKDLDMVKCFEWDRFFPVSTEDLKDEVF